MTLTSIMRLDGGVLLLIFAASTHNPLPTRHSQPYVWMGGTGSGWDAPTCFIALPICADR